jgi:hypothetical protein
MFDEALSPEQLIVIIALSEGVNLTDAAAQAGIHRNTIANWRRNSLFFREALADAQYDRALFFRDQAEDRLDLAFKTVDSVLNDPKASPSVRLKAAMFIIGKAVTPPAPRKQVPFDVQEIRVTKAPPAQTVPKVHNQAQQPAAQPHAENQPSAHQDAQNAQNAQTPFRRETPKVGRNEACPCGSGRKYKHCCLNQPQSTTEAAAA